MMNRLQQPGKKKTFKYILWFVALFLAATVAANLMTDKDGSGPGVENGKPVAEAGAAGAAEAEAIPLEKIVQAIGKMDSQITDVKVFANGEGTVIPVITFRAGARIDPLLAESADLLKIAREITEMKGSERFTGITFDLMEPVVDAYNNKSNAVTLRMAWKMETLKKINWSGFENWQFLNLVDGFEPVGHLGQKTIQIYCKENHGYNEVFCRKVGAWR